MKRSVVAPGKVVLVGEYAVVDGGPAIVMAVDRGVRCDVLDGSGIETPDGDVRFVAPAIGDAATRDRFVFSDWNPPDVGGDKPGLGGSAAACVAACIAVDRPATDAYEIHSTVQGGGSGVDVAASVYGGILLFERRKVVALSPLQPVVVYSGSGAATGPRIERYRAWGDRPAFVRESRLAVYAFLDDPLAGMERDAALLDRMVASAGIDYWTPRLRAIVEAARACGGAAKPSGAGGGDCAVALFSSGADRAAFRERCAADGFPVIDVRPAEAARRIEDEGEEASMSGSDIGSRKSEHLDLCIEDDVAFQDKTNLFEEVHLVHDALPELALDEIDLRTELVGKTLKAPLVIAAMTGGVERANAINRDLASVAEELGIGFALGSQRPLLSHGIEDGYRVRDVAPTALVLGNIGLVQARETSTAALGRLVEQVGADALCLHLNPAMEVVQPGGDRDFRGGLDTIARVVRELPVPVIVKETGCGLSRRVGERIKECGVQWVDTSGAGGTSWVGVETKRAKATKALGERFWDWGIPTAASVLQLRGLGLGIVATGGMTDGLMIARALALGARAGGIARPFLQAHAQGGRDAARTLATNVIEEIRLACLLTGSRTPADLAKAPVVLGPRLQRWAPA